MELSHIAVLMKGGKDTPKAYFEKPAKEFMKAGKYIRRTPKQGGGYTYTYAPKDAPVRPNIREDREAKGDARKDASKINKRIKVLNDKIREKKSEIERTESRMKLLLPGKGGIEKSTVENMGDGADGPIKGDLDFISQTMLGKAQHARNKKHKLAGLDSAMQAELGVPL